MDHHLLQHGGEMTAMSRRPAAAESALRAVQKPPAKPWRAAGGASASSSSSPAPAPPRVYRVEPREFRDLVQRLTGAPPRMMHHPQAQPPMVAAPTPQPVALRSAGSGGGEEESGGPQMYAAAPWCSFPMAGSGLDAAHHGNGALI